MCFNFLKHFLKQKADDTYAVKTADNLLTLKTLKTFIATVCQYNTMLFVYKMYRKSIFISKRLYIKIRGPNCKL